MLLSITTRYTAVFAISIALALTAGCASKGGSNAEDAAVAAGPKLLTDGKSVGDLSVSLDSSALAADVLPLAEQYSVASKLDTSMRGRNEVGGGDLAVDVQVVSMRLRSVGAAMGAGLFSGVDWIAVKVAVSENGAVVKEFEEKSSNSLGGLTHGGREKRVDRMVKDLTNRIIKRI